MSNIKRIISYDYMRIVAVLAVIMIHVSARFVVNNSIESDEFFIGNICDSISRFAVPIFVMISGALMLDENKLITINKLLKHAGIILLLLFFWSVFYSIVYSVAIPLLSRNEIYWGDVVYRIVFGHYHLWYLYMIIGMYIITPILRLFVNKKISDLSFILLCFLSYSSLLSRCLMLFLMLLVELLI